MPANNHPIILEETMTVILDPNGMTFVTPELALIDSTTENSVHLLAMVNELEDPTTVAEVSAQKMYTRVDFPELKR